MKIRFISILSIVILLLLAIASCVKTEENKIVAPAPTNDLSKHTIYSEYQFDNTENVINLGTQPLYMPTGLITEAMKRDNILKNALQDLGVEIRFYAFLKGNDLNFFLKKGDLDAGIGGALPAIMIASTSEVIIPAMIQKGFISIVADHPMFLHQQKGKRIGYAIGSNSHYLLLRALLTEGLDETDVKLIPMDVSEMPEALVAGKIDSFSAWEPTPFLTTSKYPDKAVIHKSLSTGYIYFSRSLYEKHPDAVRQILAAELRAFNWIKLNKANLLTTSQWTIGKCCELSKEMSELSHIDISNIASNDILGQSLSPFIPLTSLARTGRLYTEFEFLKESGMIPSSTAWNKVYDSFALQILEEIVSDPSRYSLNEFNYDLDGEGSE